MISTVVFNGRVHAIDPLTGQKIQPHLITLRATREQFTHTRSWTSRSSSRSSASAGTSSPTSRRTQTN